MRTRCPLALCWAFGAPLFIGWSFAQRDIVPDIQTTNIEHLQPRFFQNLGSERVKIRYGPYSAPAASENMGMKSYMLGNITRPCNDCYITSWTADLEFPDGSHANANTSMWLHHLLVLNPKRRDATCPQGFRGPGIERTFVSGNERGTTDLTLNGTFKSGYYIGPTDLLDMGHELMNTANTTRDAVVVMDWEFVRATPAINETFRAVRPVYLDVDGVCGSFINTSEVAVPVGQSTFTLSMEPGWNASIAGDIVTIFSHVHDGGLVLETMRNGQVVCRAETKYGETPGYVDPPWFMDGGMEMDGMDHISSIHWCNKVGRVEIGDVWSVRARYDLAEHPPMSEDDGRPSPVMGLNAMFIAV